MMEGFAWNDERLDAMIAAMSGMKPVGGTGIPSLDAILGGGLYPEVYVLAAEPGAGKTTLALQIADYVACYGSRKAVFLSMEMGAPQILGKSLSRLTSQRDMGGLPLTAREVMRMGDGDQDKLSAIERAIEAYRLEIAPNVATIDDKASVEEVAALYEAGLDPCEPKPVLVVDYLQIMPDGANPSATDYQHHTANMRGLCAISKRHRVPILVISSKNRQKRGSRALDALAGSSDIEYGASVVMFLSVDGDTEDEAESNAKLDARPVTLSVRKNRFGSVGDVPLVFKASESLFMERALS
ncbi:DnaB-like helicase C-terminal domain-containing protein [Arabiibacter massiliensis]|uniref:DnaB-like helicase C-terminal domain-containing protein n=1 Tax=Arabiibacter massiliensis TaxID=1870985 RepID=UPI0009B98C48|nr:DnaB-like helicase C-terminal domain-containing protein [Arabiibacter massiliensis]